ncbi:11369_t:CDS:1, partial [Funneliformis geosporum]
KIAKLFELNKQNTEAYKAFSGKIWELKKKLDDYHSEYNSLKKM